MRQGLQLFDLTGRSAIITGGSKGLGLAMAEAVASAGADLMLVSRNLAEAQARAEEIAAKFGHLACACAADVTIPKDAERLANETMAAFGRIDVLINNAGINIRGPIRELSHDQFHQVMRTNVDGLWLSTRAVIPHMKARQYGRIINMASTLGVVGLADRTPYASSKGAVVNLTRAMALEFAPFGITCNAICPAAFLTPMNESIVDDEQTTQSIVGATALKRWGRLEEIHGIAILLASDASSFMTGSIVAVDAGWTAK